MKPVGEYPPPLYAAEIASKCTGGIITSGTIPNKARWARVKPK